MSAAARPARPGALVGLCLALAFGALLAPALLVRVPPLMDYANHAARLWLIAGGAEAAPVSGFYAVDWSAASTNLGPDLLAATLGRVIGVAWLAPLLVGAAIALPALGAVMLNRAVFGGWHWWQVGFATLAWNSTLLGGFLAFQIGLGLALLAAAMEPAIARRGRPFAALGARAAIFAALVVWHVFAAAFYAALLAGLAFGAARAPLAGGAALRGAVARVAGTVAPAIAIPSVLFLLLAPSVPGGHAPPGVYESLTAYSLGGKAATLLSAFVTYHLALDLAAVLALYLVGRVLGSRAGMQAHAGLLGCALGLLLLSLAVPSVMAGTHVVDSRFPIMALLTCVAAVRPALPTARQAGLAASALLLLALARTGWITTIWQARQADVLAVERALAVLPAGAALLPAERVPSPDTPQPRGRITALGLVSFMHYAALAVPGQRAFVPNLFAARGQQPLRVLPPWDEIAAPQGMPVPVTFLAGYESLPFWRYMVGYGDAWRTRFDYVLMLNADLPPAEAEPVLPELELVADEGFARLYRIRRDGR